MSCLKIKYYKLVWKHLFLFLFFIGIQSFQGQEKDSSSSKRRPFNRKEEILFENNRYRIHNNYLTLGAGFVESTLRENTQLTVAVDYQFRIRYQKFQVGGMMSGDELFSNNYLQAHAGYGWRKENNKTNFATFIGPTYFSGVAGKSGQEPDLFTGFGVYASIQAVLKIKYDIGIGVELFGEVNYKQNYFGIKFIAFFSGSYRGVKKRVNPNVRTSPK